MNGGLLALVGLGIAVIANALRARRTGDISCLGHLFVSAEEMTTIELVLNRIGIVVFSVGVVVGLAMAVA